MDKSLKSPAAPLLEALPLAPGVAEAAAVARAVAATTLSFLITLPYREEALEPSTPLSPLAPGKYLAVESRSALPPSTPNFCPSTTSTLFTTVVREPMREKAAPTMPPPPAVAATCTPPPNPGKTCMGEDGVVVGAFTPGLVAEEEEEEEEAKRTLEVAVDTEAEAVKAFHAVVGTEMRWERRTKPVPLCTGSRPHPLPASTTATMISSLEASCLTGTSHARRTPTTLPPKKGRQPLALGVRSGEAGGARVPASAETPPPGRVCRRGATPGGRVVCQVEYSLQAISLTTGAATAWGRRTPKRGGGRVGTERLAMGVPCWCWWERMGGKLGKAPATGREAEKGMGAAEVAEEEVEEEKAPALLLLWAAR